MSAGDRRAATLVELLERLSEDADYDSDDRPTKGMRNRNPFDDDRCYKQKVDSFREKDDNHKPPWP